MQNCPRQLAMQSCVLCSFVRCGTSNQIEKKRKKDELPITQSDDAPGSQPLPPQSNEPAAQNDSSADHLTLRRSTRVRHSTKVYEPETGTFVDRDP